MAIEIERKFLIKGNEWREQVISKELYRQGYLPTQVPTTVRVRIVKDVGYLTIKSATVGITRTEYEYQIPITDATEMLDNLCQSPLIEKYRHKIKQDDLIWEIDEFLGDNHGLILAELELPDPNYFLILPSWIGEDVSSDQRYYNSNLVKHPFKNWKS